MKKRERILEKKNNNTKTILNLNEYFLVNIK